MDTAVKVELLTGLQVHDLHFTLTAQSAFTRCYDVFFRGRHAGTIQPMHPFTRRASIECARRCPNLPDSLPSGWRC